MYVPMNDLKIQYKRYKSEIDNAIFDLIQDSSFILGTSVREFEREFASFVDVRTCIGVSNGTDALKLALLAADIGVGDEVITVANTFGATVEAICHTGACPVLVDIHPEYYTMDISKVENSITAHTRAIIPVHLYGQTADMDPLLDLAKQNDLVVIEDAAQAHGATYKGQMAGGLGDLGCFSFYPGKNLGAYGDAGCVVTQDPELDMKIRQLRNHGQNADDKFNYQSIGFNHRMDGIQGAVLNVKLKYLNEWNHRRCILAERYEIGLQQVNEVQLPREAEYAGHVYHLYVIQVDEREELKKFLKHEGVDTSIQYPYPLHLTTAYEFLPYQEGDMPVCEEASKRILSLPLFPDMERDQIDFVIYKIREFYR